MKYVIVTAAKNEEEYIENTLRAVTSQTVRPSEWVIVDDDSHDGTADIAKAYAARNPWIVVIRRVAAADRNFASKARAFAMGYGLLRTSDFDCVGNLDADVSFAADYFERLLEFFRGDPALGIAGGRFRDFASDGKSHPSTNSPDSVRGPAQMFRRKCYEDIGGYQPLAKGGIDAAAEITARMKGWKVRTLPELEVLHLRPTGSALWSPLSAMLRNGIQDYSLGYHGLFEALRCGVQMGKRPFAVGGLARLFGYCWAWIRGDPLSLPAETVSYLRSEQRRKLLRLPKRIGRLVLSRIITTLPRIEIP
jgi:glycosyltransferase involved in cell wall biosynthesis